MKTPPVKKELNNKERRMKVRKWKKEENEWNEIKTEKTKKKQEITEYGLN